MISKKPKLKVTSTTKVNNRVVITSVIIIIIAAASLVTASLLTPGGVGNFYAGSGNINLSNIPIPVSGWCVTGLGLFGDNGDHTTRDNCKARATDNDPNTNWYAFCPDIAGQGERDESSCDCNATDIEKSSALSDVISLRAGLIDALNDGNISQTDMEKQFKFMIAVHIDCACPVYSAGNYDGAATDNNANTSADPARKLYTVGIGGKDVTGVHTFLRKVAKMYSKMYGAPPKCESLPASCVLNSSYRGDEDDKFVPFSDWNNENKSAHDTGQAADIACAGAATSAGSGCTGDAATAETKIRGAASGLNVLRECNVTEKNICGQAGSTQLVHVDEKTRGTNNPDNKACYYINCNFSSCGDL
ncbi:MAG: hypothetical protein HUU49_03785 [Candidatus Buchananbacteria bacterium]|nr:hypothetical protein [Candidatus Buchananbacteria bacterium]